MYDSYQEESLEHYGVKGMKWGVRRYQKNAGTYTKKGIKNFYKALNEYEKAQKNKEKAEHQLRNNQITRREYNRIKGEVGRKKYELEKSYDKLAYDQMTDKGKKLYESGHTIEEGETKSLIAQVAVVAGGAATSAILYRSGNTSMAQASAATSAVVTAAINDANRVKANQLRLYYSRWDEEK